MLKFSIITINYNNCEGLKYTYESVRSQSFTDYEWIIIDGASTDGSREFIEKHTDEFAYWVSEPDKGVYNAMNKGIRVATGEYAIFMNSGDRFHSPVVLEEFSCITADMAVGYTDCVILGKLVKRLTVPPIMTARQIIAFGVNHQSVFVRTQLLQKRLYDENLRYVSDYKFFLQILLEDNCSYQALPIIVADYDYSGMTSMEENLKAQNQERSMVLREILPPRIYTDYRNWIEGTTKLQKVLNQINEDSISYRLITFCAVFIRSIQTSFAQIKYKFINPNA